jgi:hypothetical protein
VAGSRIEADRVDARADVDQLARNARSAGENRGRAPSSCRSRRVIWWRSVRISASSAPSSPERLLSLAIPDHLSRKQKRSAP